MDSVNFVVLGILIFGIAVSMTMVGKGGGNFYVVFMLFFGVSAHIAATTGQFILFMASFTGMLVFGKNKIINWKLVGLIGSFLGVGAFLGGFYSYLLDEFTLKMVFAVLLIISGIFMILPYSESVSKEIPSNYRYLTISGLDGEISIDLIQVIPLSALIGFFSGMVGVSGGSLIVPMLVIICKVPMKSSVSTVTPLIAYSALMGFLGHGLQGHFVPALAIPLAVVTVTGGLIGAKFALNSKPDYLKALFVISNFIAALLVIIYTVQ